MAENEVSCGAQSKDTQFHLRGRNRAAHRKDCSNYRASKFAVVDGEGSSRLNLRTTSSLYKVGTSSFFSHNQRSTGLMELESSSLSSSASPRNILVGLKDSGIILSPDLRNALRRRPASSDESGTDSDLEAAERMATLLPTLKQTAGRNSSGCPSTGGIVVAVKNSGVPRGVGPPSGQRWIHGANTLNKGDRGAPSTSEPRSAHVGTGGASSFDLDRLRDFGTRKFPLNSLSTDSSSWAYQSGDCHTSLNVEDQGRPSIDPFCNFGFEVSARPQRSGLSADWADSSGQLGSGRGSERVKKTVSHSILGRRLRPMSLQSAGSKESNNTAVGIAHRIGQSRRNLSSFSCTSAADVLPSVPNTSVARVANQMRQKRAVYTAGLNNAGVSLRDTRSSMSRVASGSSGCVWRVFSNKSSDGPSADLSLRRADSQPVRRQLSGFQIDDSCPRRLLSFDSDPTAASSSTVFGDARPAVPNCRGREGRGRERDLFVSGCRHRIGGLGRSGQYLDSAIASREELPKKSSGSSSTSRSSTTGYPIDRVYADSGYPGRSTVDSFSSTSTMSSNPEAQSSLSHSRSTIDSFSSTSTMSSNREAQSSLSGPPSNRTPPVPRFGSTSMHASTSQIALPSPPFRSSSPCISHGSRSLRFLSSDDQERPDLSAAELPAHGAFQGSQLHSVGENQARLTAESISEILSALEYVERDEELSYEQILMLEATILLGGMGLHDQHRDLRLDVDNMSYEELLALEERMGKVNIGLNEQDIAKCVKNIRYVPLERTVDRVPFDVEVKCSICQEEFQDNVELGLLECGHSHHIACIKQWLLQKNQCPICKTSASA